MLLCKLSWLPSKRMRAGEEYKGVELVSRIDRSWRWWHLLWHPVLLGVVFWVAKLHLQSKNIRSAMYRRGKAELVLIFLRSSRCFSSLPLCTELALPCNQYGVWNTVVPVASSCFVEQEMLSRRSYLTSSVNGVLYHYCCCRFLLRGFVFTVRSDVRSAGMNLLCLKDTSMTLQFCRLFILMQS